MKKFFAVCILCIMAFPAYAGPAYDRVMKAQTIRCGYAIWKPILYKDANTGAIQGFAHDLIEELGRRLELKIEWTEETGWGPLVEGLASGRYDLACTGLYQNAARSRRIGFSSPLFYSPMLVAVRADEQRLKKNSDLNNTDYKIAIIEGEAGSIAARQNFPEAKTTAIPQMSDYTLVYEEVRSNKADATLIEAATFAEYNAANPKVLKILDNHPINVYPVVLGLPFDDSAFKAMIDSALSELMNDGTAERLLKKHEQFPDSFYRVSEPYRVEK